MDGGLPGLPSMPGVCTHIKSTALQGRPYVWLPWEMQREAFSLTLEPRSALCYGFFCLFQCINISFGWSDSLLFQDLCMCVLTYVCKCLKMYVGIYCLFLCMCLTECWVCHICAGTPGEARRGHQSPCSWNCTQSCKLDARKWTWVLSKYTVPLIPEHLSNPVLRLTKFQRKWVLHLGILCVESPEKVDLEYKLKVGEICLAHKDERKKLLHRLLANITFNPNVELAMFMWLKQSSNPTVGDFVKLL